MAGDEASAGWHLWIDAIPRPGWTNMAIDSALLDRAEQCDEGWLRLYTWSPHCLSFGRHEPALRRYDLGRIRELGLDTVRRPTGGRAVWHSHELTYAVAAPCSRFGSLTQAYTEIHRLLGAALGELGIEASLAAPASTPPLDFGPCFSRPVGGEVLVEGRKVIGSAQMRRGSALLQHGSILLQDEQALVSELSAPTSSSRALDSSAGLTGTHGQALPAQVVAEAVGRTAARRWPGAWNLVTEPAPVLRAAAGYFPQFISSTWTWAR